MDEIKKWLDDENGTFEGGYTLLMARSRNRHILQYLGRKRDMAKLRYELGKFVSGPESEDPAPVKAAAHEAAAPGTETLQKPHERLKIVKDGTVSYNNLPGELKPVYQSAVEVHRQMRSVHERMKLVTTDEERAAARAELLELEEKRAAAWVVIDKWGETGELPEPESNDQESGNEEPGDYKSITNARTAVSRCLRELKAEPEMDPAKRAKLIEKARHAVAVVTAAGGKFDKLLEPLRKYGVIAP